jgi:hypothetical protein
MPLPEFSHHSHADETHESDIPEEKPANGVNGADEMPEGEQEKKPKEKRQPTQFHEPDANSLLDSFGF